MSQDFPTPDNLSSPPYMDIPEYATDPNKLAVRSFFDASKKFLLNIPHTITWQKKRDMWVYCNSKGSPFSLLAIGPVTCNFLKGQGAYNQYLIKISLDELQRNSLVHTLESCPQRQSRYIPLDMDTLKVTVKYNRVFSENQIASHAGAQISFPDISDARSMTRESLSEELPKLDASDLTLNSTIAVKFGLVASSFNTTSLSTSLETVTLISLSDDAAEVSYVTPKKKCRLVLFNDSDDE